MKGKIQISLVSMLAIVLILSSNARALNSWQAPFDTTTANSGIVDSLLSLSDVLKLVAAENPTFRSLSYQLQAAGGNLKQAGLWPNPELEAEFEEVSWDSPGFKESEFSVSIAQEFELFGQRGARKNVAQSGIEATRSRIDQSVFDLYLETKQRFYALAHAQQNVNLSRTSVDLAKEIVENINFRLDRGASLQSELLLAQLEEQRALLALDQARQDVIALEATLVSLWHGKPSGAKVSTDAESYFSHLLEKINLLSSHADSARDIIQMQGELKILRAEKAMAIAETRPALTLSGGFKRLEADDSKSFLFGVSVPIPLFNRNQGTKESIDAQLRSLEYDIEQGRTEAISSIESNIIGLRNLVDRHATLDSMLLPTAEKAYHILKDAYETGRIPYTQLLEAERILNDLNFEHNDMLLEIQEQVIALESLTGVTLLVEKEN
ncbi:MAG: TolC family protein [candidate division Zixibacteria bacterium]|nr:TolC family protein [candidate division Zixibacteria bacterium]